MTALATRTPADEIKTAPKPEIPYKDAELDAIETIARTYSLANTSTLGRFQAAFAMATGLQKLWQAISNDMMQDICALAGTSLGFKTDKDSKGEKYSIDVIKECFIEATLRGARPIGNEFNVIAGRCYLTKEFYMRSFGELPGVTNVVVSPGMPNAMSDGLCGVRVALRWKRLGIDESIGGADDKPGRVFAVKYYGKLEADQVIGKALRKAYKAAYEQVTGSTLADDEDHIVDGEAVSGSSPVVSQSRTASLASKVGATLPPPPASAEPSNPASGAGQEPGEIPNDAPVLDPAAEKWDTFTVEAEAIARVKNVDPETFNAAIKAIKLTPLSRGTRSGWELRSAWLGKLASGAKLKADGTFAE